MPLRRLAQALGLVAGLLAVGGAALASSSAGANGDIVFVRGGNVVLLSSLATVVAGSDPSWSPDGTKLAYVSGGTIRSCTVSSGSCGSVVSSGVTGTEPVWSPDGTKLAYVTAGGQIHTMKPDGTSDAAVTSSGTNADPNWSPDGTELAITQNSAIATVPVGGGTVTTVTTTGVSGSSRPAWSPDASTIAFQSSSSGHSQVYVVAAGGGSPTLVASSANSQTAPAWSPDGEKIVYADATSGLSEVTQLSGGGWSSPTVVDANTSDATPAWQTVAPTAVSAPVIFSGSAPETGQLLSASNGSWSGANSFAYQWQRCNSSGASCSAIGGATGSTYAVVSADVGSTLRVVVTASNPAGSTASSASAATGVVVAAGTVRPPANTAYPTIRLPVDEPAPQVGDLLLSTVGTWSGSLPLTYTYRWTRCTSPTGDCYTIQGATGSSLKVDASLYGWSLRVEVTATNDASSAKQYSLPTSLVTATVPKAQVTPAMPATAVVDQTLRLGAGQWAGSPTIVFTYSWRRCNPVGDLASCVEIPGATGASYTPVLADIGYALRAWVTGTNVAGSGIVITNHTYPVVDKQHFSPSVVTLPTVFGIAETGFTLTATPAAFNGDAPISVTLRWQRCDATGGSCHDIVEAAKTSYVPGTSDLGSRLRVVYHATNAYGVLDADSAPTETVVASPPHRKGRTIVGTQRSDYLSGSGYDDSIRGLRGNDTLLGGAGADRLDGGAGNDVLTGGSGQDILLGGPGSDTIYARDGERDVVDCGPGNDRAVVDAGDVVRNCEVVEKP